MALTETEIKTLIGKVDDEINALLAGDGSGLVNYKVGDRSVNKTARLKELRATRKDLIRQLEALPSEERTVFDDPAL